jgi:hypothetical protein
LRFKEAMSTELFVLLALLVIAVCVVYWYVRRAKSQPDVTESISPSSAQTRPEINQFLQQLASDKAHIDEAIITAVQQHEHELEQRFIDDVKYVKLKEQLSQLTHMNELDKALIALWEEVKYYPMRSSQDDFDNWNKLNLTGIGGSSEGDINSVEFVRGTQRFKVRERTRDEIGNLNADLSFFEDGDEVFAINCLVDSRNEGADYICQFISAFKTRGNWPKVLLEYYGQLKIEKSKSLNEVKYFRAAETKSRFG